MTTSNNQQSRQLLKEFHPGHDDHELIRLEEQFTNYLKAVLRVCEEIESNPQKLARFRTLTAPKRSARMAPQSHR